MTDTVTCPSCRRLLQLPEHVLDQEARCPGCGETFTARPKKEPPPAAPPAASKAESAWDAGRSAKTRANAWEAVDEWQRQPPRTLPGGNLSIVLMVLLAVNVVAELVSMAHSALMLVQPPDLDFQFEEDVAVGCLTLMVFLPTAVVFCIWMHRSYQNLLDLGVRGLRHTPNWAFGAFFVPILNLFRPCEIAQEMWRASAPSPREDDYGWRQGSGSTVVGLWWAFWLISYIVSGIVARIAMSDRPGDFETAAKIGMFAGGLNCLAALFAILMVRGLRNRQEQKLASLRPLGETSAED